MDTVKRKILGEIFEWLDSPHLLVIHGARRAGKTTLMNQIQDHLQTKGYDVVYLAVDQMLFEPWLKDPLSLENWLRHEGHLNEGRLYLLLDEAQYLPDTGLFLKVLYDRLSPHAKIIISGSSSLELGRTKEFLTGRKIEFTLERFSFLEFISLKYHKHFVEHAPFDNVGQLQEVYQLYHRDLEQLLVEYITWGGYPEVALEQNVNRRDRILREILSVYLEKDISAFLRIRHVGSFNNLIKILASQTGGLVNKTELSNTLGMRFETVNSYLNILENTFVFSLLKPYFKNVRKEISKSPKVYARDFGIIYYTLKRRFDDYQFIPGDLVENFVYRELLERFDANEIHFYRTLAGGEIDFVVPAGTKTWVVESKFRTQKRFPKAMKNFMDNYRDTEVIPIIITKDILAQDKGVLFLPAVCLPLWKWGEGKEARG